MGVDYQNYYNFAASYTRKLCFCAPTVKAIEFFDYCSNPLNGKKQLSNSQSEQTSLNGVQRVVNKMKKSYSLQHIYENFQKYISGASY